MVLITVDYGGGGVTYVKNDYVVCERSLTENYIDIWPFPVHDSQNR